MKHDFEREEYEREGDGLGFARGIVNGLCVFLLFWVIVAMVWTFLTTAATVGPNCPGNVDPQWLGRCDAEEAQTQ